VIARHHHHGVVQPARRRQPVEQRIACELLLRQTL
jgi:hypothetical protein